MRTKIKKLIIKLGYTVYKIIRIPLKLYWKFFNIQTKGVRVLIVSKNHVALVRHWYNPLWVMPGGGIHKNELPEQAAIREIKEEIGIQIKQLEYVLGVYENKKEGKNDKVYCYVAFVGDMYDFSKNRLNIEISDVIWAPLDNLPEGTSIATKQRILEYSNQDHTEDIRVW